MEQSSTDESSPLSSLSDLTAQAGSSSLANFAALLSPPPLQQPRGRSWTPTRRHRHQYQLRRTQSLSVQQMRRAELQQQNANSSPGRGRGRTSKKTVKKDRPPPQHVLSLSDEVAGPSGLHLLPAPRNTVGQNQLDHEQPLDLSRSSTLGRQTGPDLAYSDLMQESTQSAVMTTHSSDDGRPFNELGPEPLSSDSNHPLLPPPLRQRLPGAPVNRRERQNTSRLCRFFCFLTPCVTCRIRRR